MVKKFARWEVAEQDTIADILRSMEMEGKAEGAFKPASDSEVEAMLDARRARLVSPVCSIRTRSFSDQSPIAAGVILGTKPVPSGSGPPAKRVCGTIAPAKFRDEWQSAQCASVSTK